MTKRTYLIILAIGAALRLLLIWQAELWYDETFTWVVTRLPLINNLVAAMGDVHPPLYHLLLWPLGQIPNLPPWTLRLPSALCSIVSLALLPRLMRGLRIPDPVQLIAFGMMAVLPMQIAYAQEARMYGLLELLTVVGALAVIEGRPALLGLMTAALLYTHNYGTFYVAALTGLLLMVIYQQWERHRITMMDLRTAASDIGLDAMKQIDPLDDAMRRDLRRKWWALARAMFVGVLVWLPWLPIMLQQAAAIRGNYWIFPSTAGDTLYAMFELFWSLSMNTAAANALGMLVTFALLIVAVWYLVTRRPDAWVIIAWMAFGPIAMALIVSLVLQPILLYRALIGVTPFLYLACAYPLAQIATLRARLYAACFAVPVLMLGIAGYYYYNPQQKTTLGAGSMAQAVEYIHANWQPGDVILHGNFLEWISMRPYRQLPEQYALPDCTRIPGGLSNMTVGAIGVPMVDIDQLPPHRRVWLTAVYNPMTPRCEQARTDAIIAGRAPVLVLSESRFIYSAIWLLGDQ